MPALRDPKSENFREFISSRPASQKRYLKQLAPILHGMSNEQIEIFVHAVPKFLEDSSFVADEKLWESVNITEQELFTLIRALTNFTPPIIAEENIDDVVQILTEEQIVNDEGAADVLRLLKPLSSISKILGRTNESARLSRSVLPSYDEFEVAVDIRLKFDEERKAILAVPVIIAFIDTDASEQAIWFQLSKSQLKTMKKVVDRATVELAEAEKLISQKTLCDD